MTVMPTAILMTRPKEVGPHVARTNGIFMQNLLAFPEGVLCSLLPCLCIFWLCYWKFLTFILSVTDVSPESEKENSDWAIFLFVSEDCESEVTTPLFVNNGDVVNTRPWPWFIG